MRSSPCALIGERMLVRQCSLCVILVALTVGLPLEAIAQGADLPLTLETAQRLAVDRSRQLSAQDSAIIASREMAVAAGQLPDPVLKFGLDSWPVDGRHQFSVGGDDFTEGRVGLSQELTGRKKRALRAQRFERASETTLAEKTATVAAIERDTALAWIDRYYLEAMAAVLAKQAEEVQLEITAANGTYRAGRGNQADVLTAHSALAEIEDRASDIERRILTAKTALSRWVGDAGSLPLADKPAIDSVHLDQSTLESQVSHHPEIAVFAKREELAWADVNLAEASKRADWSVEVAYAQRGSGFSDFVSVSLSIPLQWDQKNRQDREVAAKMAMAEQAGAEREEAVRSDVSEVLAQLQEWDSNRKRLTHYQNQIIPLGQERTKAAMTAYFGGKGTISELLLARRDEIDVRVRALQLEMDTARLWAQLNFLVPDIEVAAPNSDEAQSPSTRIEAAR